MGSSKDGIGGPLDQRRNDGESIVDHGTLYGGQAGPPRHRRRYVLSLNVALPNRHNTGSPGSNTITRVALEAELVDNERVVTPEDWARYTAVNAGVRQARAAWEVVSMASPQ
jgi:hypothetical protein